MQPSFDDSKPYVSHLPESATEDGLRGLFGSVAPVLLSFGLLYFMSNKCKTSSPIELGADCYFGLSNFRMNEFQHEEFRLCFVSLSSGQTHTVRPSARGGVLVPFCEAAHVVCR
jgi:hypothetical protein